MESILIFIKKIIPVWLFKKIQPGYHYVLNFIAAVFYGFPSNKLIVVGVTGTTGKTTVTYLAAQVLQGAGVKVGYTSTAMFSDGETEVLNDKKMTMLGRFFTQKILAKMVRNGCRVAIVETTSEGIVQFRHRFINYDILLFTGLYPEHIDSHGSFDNYKNAKLELFKHLKQCKKKDVRVMGGAIHKTIIVNGDDEHATDFLAPWAQEKIAFVESNHGAVADGQSQDVKNISYSYLETNNTGLKFTFDGEDMQLQLLGEFTALNATAAASIAQSLGLSSVDIKKSLAQISGVPGRLEKIDEGQDFTVIVDYAFEPVAVGKLYETIVPLEPRQIIHVLGSTGGGRDVSRRAALGVLAGQKADIVIVTNEDPYDDDPMEIIDGVTDGAVESGKKDGENLFRILERGEAIAKAINCAQTGDVVLITGKGSEQAIVTKDNKKIPWDDRDAAREALKKDHL